MDANLKSKGIFGVIRNIKPKEEKIKFDSKTYNSNYNQINKEKIKERKKRHYEQNKEKIKEKNLNRYYEENRNKRLLHYQEHKYEICLKRKQLYEENYKSVLEKRNFNKEKIKEYKKIWYEKKKDKLKIIKEER